jgi:hypothetical protein
MISGYCDNCNASKVDVTASTGTWLCKDCLFKGIDSGDIKVGQSNCSWCGDDGAGVCESCAESSSCSNCGDSDINMYCMYCARENMECSECSMTAEHIVCSEHNIKVCEECGSEFETTTLCGECYDSVVSPQPVKMDNNITVEKDGSMTTPDGMAINWS